MISELYTYTTVLWLRMYFVDFCYTSNKYVISFSISCIHGGENHEWCI